MRSLKAFLLGAFAAGVVAYAAAAALGVSAQAAGRALRVGVGPLGIVSVTEHGPGTVITFGPGLPVLALAGGLLNLWAAGLIARRSAREADHVD